MEHLTREVLDTVLPKTIRLEDKARKIAGISKHDVRPLEACLIWLADTAESDRFSGFGDRAPNWRKNPANRILGDWWDLQIGGLQYKPSSHYLTLEGWPAGTTCWYVRIECGWREFVAATEPTLAALRAVIVVHCWMEWRRLPPDERPELIDKIKEFMAL